MPVTKIDPMVAFFLSGRGRFIGITDDRRELLHMDGEVTASTSGKLAQESA